MCLGVLRVEDDLRKRKMILTRCSWNRGPVKSGEPGFALGVNLAAGSTGVKYMLSGDCLVLWCVQLGSRQPAPDSCQNQRPFPVCERPPTGAAAGGVWPGLQAWLQHLVVL